MDRHPVPATPPPVSRREELARAWTAEATSSAYIPRAVVEVEELLLELVDELLAALAGEEKPDEVGLRVGARLVDEGFIDPTALRATIDSLSAGLLADLVHTPDNELARRAVVLLGALSAGYAGGLRGYTLTQQEQVKQALFNAMVRTEHNLRATENRFREVFTSSAVGIAITNLDGMCVESNPALSQILACPPGQLAGRMLHDFFLADEDLHGARGTPGDVRSSYRRVLAGDAERVHEHRRLRKEDGETAWVFLAISLLHDGAGDPAYFVTMVQDISELQLLQDRLSHQLLYDALTGLPNRQHFTSKLESTLGRVEPGGAVTLCLVNLDGFAAVNNGFGHEFGDRLLKTVGHRLEGMAEGERTLVARIGPDEFAVLFEDPPAAPPLDEVIGRINAELEEAEFIDERGVGVGATIGTARCGADEMSAAELFRAADSALRKAKVTGRRQWAAFHPGDDYRCRDDDALAVQLPAAWETGELTVAYEPVVRATDQHAVAARPVLVWEREDGETIGHRDCVALGERTGISVQLGPAILREVCARLPELRATLGEAPGALLRLQLSRLQSADGDLVSAVHRAIKETGVPADLLEIGLDTTAVLDHVYGDARENLDVLAEVGVGIALCGFQGGPRELDLLADTGVRAVTLAADGAGAAGRDTASE
ncbi:diguanylate cyclase domain-containing protein, partial [Actinophytocola sp.]|uniref:diguanylate cyclase domain-containing protein n=1 Tax=Actinophytocola sp. TaxID=1872138 RepID=UPI003D6BAD33